LSSTAVEIDRLRPRRRRTREHQETGDDLLDPVQLLDDVFQVLAPRILGLELRADELNGGTDPGQGVADLVGDVGGELAERHQPVDLLLELAILGFGDRLGQDHGADRLAVLVADRQRFRLERELATLGLEPELARLAGGALEPARVGAGNRRDPAEPTSVPLSAPSSSSMRRLL
jgi:hypothetical protein